VVGVTFADADYSVDPYPGARPDCSFVHLDGRGHPIDLHRDGWRAELDSWLVDHDAAPLAGRAAVLAYGSNACPGKITWLRERYGLAGPVIVLRARCEGLAAVWAAGYRVVDDQRPATLAAAPGVVEWHAVWLATPAQVGALDLCEGRGERYDLARIHSGQVTDETGADFAELLAYVGRDAMRLPLLVDGQVVRCSDVAQQRAQRLPGIAAASDGLHRTVLHVARV
jgi:hypothetical protein